MILKFPELRGGQAQGLNDAGVENFQGAIDEFLSRECGQNTADAPGTGVMTVRLEFERIKIRSEEIPCFQTLRETLRACLARSQGKAKEREFFEQAVQLASKDEIDVLKISDYGTTGLTGSDTDEFGRWFALVKSQGVSNKGDTAGGSFGIGKSSPFAASRFRTVFYGTKTEKGDQALQGVVRLVTHNDPKGRLTQGVGFIGDYDEKGGEGAEPLFKAVRKDIPGIFQRSESGTDIWIVGYRSGAEWEVSLIRSILSNFWPAIFEGTIRFKVGKVEIRKDNLADLIRRHSRDEEFVAHHYHRAILSQPIAKRLLHVGDCELFLMPGDSDLPKKICMVRKSGMRIYDYAPKACRVPFVGLFRCRDAEGNRLLRKLEPPKHDTWDPKRDEGQEGKQALDEIKGWIREEVKKLNPLYAGKSFNEDELSKYLPDDVSENEPDADSGSSEEEGLDPKPRNVDPAVASLSVKPVQAPIAATGGTAGSADFAREKNGGGGDPGGGGDEDAGQDGGEGEEKKKGKENKPPKVFVRTYQSSPVEYQVVLRSPVRFGGSIAIFAVGEDGTQDSVKVSRATLAGKKLPLKDSVIGGIQLKPGEPLRIVVRLDELERRSLTAVAQL